jgi:dienelactone hydrolase
VAKYISLQSNFSLSAAAGVGKYRGVGPWGTYDMAGNVAEWCRNESGDNSHYVLGGAWSSPSYSYYDPASLPPFERHAGIGFRCVRNTSAPPPAAYAAKSFLIRDFSQARPASDEVFRIYRAMYAYDPAPLNAKTAPIAQDSPDWRKERIEFDAAYGQERMMAYLFLPANVRPPYQAVVFYPSARVLDIPSSATLGDMKFVDYVIKSGRAVLYPVYKGTYERRSLKPAGTPTAYREFLIQQSKDLGRSIDFLESRADIDRARIGYLGVSMGTAFGVILTALEERLKTVVFLDGGFFSIPPLPGTDQVDFASRMKKPALMINGRYDWVFQGKDAMFRMLGTPPADKKMVTFESGHDVREQRADLIREVVAWLDKYLGKVN